MAQLESANQEICSGTSTPKGMLMFDIPKEFHHGPARVLERISAPFPGVLPDRSLPGHIGAGKNPLSSAQQKDGKSHPVQEGRFGYGTRGRQRRHHRGL